MPLEVEDMDQLEFEREKAHNRRHKELLGSLNLLASEIGKKTDDGLKDKLDKHLQAIGKLAESMKSMPKPDAPIVNVSANNKEIVESFSHIADQITAEISSLKECLVEKPRQWEFTVTRGRNGFIESINAKAK